MTDNKNTILAIVLSAIVLIGWQFFFAMPQEKARQEKQQAEQLVQKQKQPVQPGQSGQPVQSPAQAGPAQPPGQTAEAPASASREAALTKSTRVAIATDSLQGSIALKGGRIDDLSLVKFRETVDPKSPPIILLSPSGSPEPFYAEFGWTGTAGASVKVPNSDTTWTQQGSGALSASHPVTLTYDNGAGLEFRRTIAVDDKYVFTIKDEVVNKSTAPVSLYP
ncbi:MAG: membrane protein insertase YidC, partial [Pseudolabrys sp.]